MSNCVIVDLSLSLQSLSISAHPSKCIGNVECECECNSISIILTVNLNTASAIEHFHRFRAPTILSWLAPSDAGELTTSTSPRWPPGTRPSA